MSTDAASGETIGASGQIGRPGPSWRGDAVRRSTPDTPGELSDLLVPRRPCTLRRRLACFVIDQVVVWSIVLVLASIALAVAGVEEEPAPGTREAGILETVGLLSLVLPLFYFWVWNSVGFTPGKQMLGVRVVNEQGGVPGVMRGFARTAASLLAPLSFGFSYAWAAWDADPERPFATGRGQAWHDKLSGTLVVRL